MLKYIDCNKMGRGVLDWLDSHFHFSFADYFNPNNVRFGVLRVINDDLIRSGAGFDTHPHRDMEIISYVVDGELTHADSMGNRRTLTRGQVQYMCAGTGVLHSEHNYGKDPLRLLQVWIFPDREGYKPDYGENHFEMEDRRDRWMPIATWTENERSKAPIRIHADVDVSCSLVSKGNVLPLEVGKGRQAYLVLIEGEAEVGRIPMKERDAMEITEQDVDIKAREESHIFVMEMARE